MSLITAENRENTTEKEAVSGQKKKAEHKRTKRKPDAANYGSSPESPPARGQGLDNAYLYSPILRHYSGCESQCT